MEMDQSNGDEVKALKESVSRLAISIKNADSELAVAADACPLRTCNAISGGRGAEQGECPSLG